jgi:hypothetical protein
VKRPLARGNRIGLATDQPEGVGHARLTAIQYAASMAEIGTSKVLSVAPLGHHPASPAAMEIAAPACDAIHPVTGARERR